MKTRPTYIELGINCEWDRVVAMSFVNDNDTPSNIQFFCESNGKFETTKNLEQKSDTILVFEYSHILKRNNNIVSNSISNVRIIRNKDKIFIHLPLMFNTIKILLKKNNKIMECSYYTLVNEPKSLPTTKITKNTPQAIKETIQQQFLQLHQQHQRNRYNLGIALQFNLTKFLNGLDNKHPQEELFFISCVEKFPKWSNEINKFSQLDLFRLPDPETLVTDIVIGQYEGKLLAETAKKQNQNFVLQIEQIFKIKSLYLPLFTGKINLEIGTNKICGILLNLGHPSEQLQFMFISYCQIKGDITTPGFYLGQISTEKKINGNWQSSCPLDQNFTCEKIGGEFELMKH